MKRAAQPVLSFIGELALSSYERHLRVEEDLSTVSIRNYLSDLRQVAAWCEQTWQHSREEALAFLPRAVTTPTLTDYRAYLQHTLHLKPNSVNRSLISLKRYFAWLVASEQLRYDPAKIIKLVGEEATPPRHLDDQEEQALVAAVTEAGSARDQAIIVLTFHTGLHAREICTLTRAHIRLGKRSGTMIVHGKRNKYREIPLNATARAALLAYDASLVKQSHDTTPLFLSEKRHAQLTERGLGYLIKKYAVRANLSDISPHDLRHRFGYRMARTVPLHRLAQLMSMTPLIRPCCTHRERRTICSRPLRRLLGARSIHDEATEQND